MEKKKSPKIKIKAIIAVFMVFLCIIIGALPISAQTATDKTTSGTALRSASNVESVTIIFETNSGHYGTVNFDLGAALYGNQTQYGSIIVTNQNLANTSVTTWYEYELFYSWTKYAETPHDEQWALECEFNVTRIEYKSLNNQQPQEYSYSETANIKKMRFQYGTNELHNTSGYGTFAYAHSGGISPYVTFGSTLTSLRVQHSMKVKTWEYNRYYKTGVCDFSNIRTIRNNYTLDYTLNNIDVAAVYPDYGSVSALYNNKIYNALPTSVQQPLDTQYQYVMADSAYTLLILSANTSVNTFSFVEWYDYNSGTNTNRLPTYRNDYPNLNNVEDFEIGTFLKTSVSNFLTLEIMPGFSLAAVLYTVFGILVLVALLKVLAGK